MKYEAFKKKLERAGMTIGSFAELLNMNLVSITNYSMVGVVPSHVAVIVTYMELMAKAGIDFRTPVQKLRLVRKKPRGASAAP